MKTEVLARINGIKLFLFDLEGVLHNDNSEEEKCVDSITKMCFEFNALGLKFGIVTGRKEDGLIDSIKSIPGCIVLAGSLAKVEVTDKLLHSLSLDYKDVFYMGDDLLDIPLLQKCGLSFAPKSARREVKRAATFTTSASGCEEILTEIYDFLKKIKEPAGSGTN